MVDFGKHGKCITLKRFQSFRDLLRKLEIEELNGQAPNSVKILDKIMHSVKIDGKLRQYMENDWEHSIKQNIKMSVEIIDSTGNNVYTLPKYYPDTEPLNGQEEEDINQQQHEEFKFLDYLNDVHFKIIEPMTEKLKEIMIQF